MYPLRSILTALYLVLLSGLSFGQAQLVINGAFVVLKDGSNTTPIYLVVDNPDSNAIIRNSGHVISEEENNFLKWNLGTNQYRFIYPFGYSTTDYLPFTYSKADATDVKVAMSTWSTDQHNNPHPLGVTHMDGVGDSITAAIDRFWTMESSATSSGYLTYSYRGAENTCVNPTTSQFPVQTWLGTDWSSQSYGGNLGVTAGVGNSSMGDTTRVGRYSYVLVRAGFALPVEWLGFSVDWKSKNRKTAIIKWSTSSELNLSHFVLERSSDGKEFSAMGKVASTGNSNSVKNYVLEDDLSEHSGTVFYYRIRQVDYDEHESLSKIKTINRGDIGTFAIKVYPNPSNGEFSIVMNSSFETESNLTLYNSIGAKVWENSIKIKKDSETVHAFQPKTLERGTYFLYVESRGERYTYKLIVM